MLNSLKPAKGSKRNRKKVGRGGDHGTFCCRGVKGQKARSGYSRRLGFEGGRTPLVAQLPKVAGFKSIKEKPVTITLEMINKKYKDGQTVSSKTLKENNLLKYKKNSFKIVKTGDLDFKINVIGGKVSKGAEEIITKAGGEVKKTKEKVKEKK